MIISLIGGVLAAKAKQVRARYAYAGKHWPIG